MRLAWAVSGGDAWKARRVRAKVFEPFTHAYALWYSEADPIARQLRDPLRALEQHVRHDAVAERAEVVVAAADAAGEAGGDEFEEAPGVAEVVDRVESRPHRERPLEQRRPHPEREPRKHTAG